MKTWRTVGIVLGSAVALLVAAMPASAASSDNPDNPAPQGHKESVRQADDYAPDQCWYLRQMEPAEQKYRSVNNTPFTYADSVFGTDWFDVACGQLAFTVPFGKQALVDLTAVAELDCQSSAPAPTNAWCGGRFLVNGAPILPDNTGRGDSYAWDSANGGNYDWQANTLAQEYIATCKNAEQQPCVYKVTLQSRLENGATSVWIDDLTVRVDVTVGAVAVVAGATTP